MLTAVRIDVVAQRPEIGDQEVKAGFCNMVRLTGAAPSFGHVRLTRTRVQVSAPKVGQNLALNGRLLVLI